MDDNHFSVEPYAPWGMFPKPKPEIIGYGYRMNGTDYPLPIPKELKKFPCIDEGPEVY